MPNRIRRHVHFKYFFTVHDLWGRPRPKTVSKLDKHISYVIDFLAPTVLQCTIVDSKIKYFVMEDSYSNEDENNDSISIIKLTSKSIIDSISIVGPKKSAMRILLVVAMRATIQHPRSKQYQSRSQMLSLWEALQ